MYILGSFHIDFLFDHMLLVLPNKLLLVTLMLRVACLGCNMTGDCIGPFHISQDIMQCSSFHVHYWSHVL